MGNSPVMGVDPDGKIFGTVVTAVGDFFKTGLFDGGFDPSGLWNGGEWGYFRNAWSGYDPLAKGTLTNTAWQIDKGIAYVDKDRTWLGQAWQITSKLTWELHQTILGNIAAHGLNITGNVNQVNYFRGATVLDTDLQNGAFTLGSYIIGEKGFSDNFRDHLFVHEYGHYIQSQRFGPFYLKLVALPSVTSFYIDEIFGTDLHDTRWYETNANKLAADYFDEKKGSGAEGYFPMSQNHFDRNSFINDNVISPYTNPRAGGNNRGGRPTKSRFHWTDIPIGFRYNNGIGLLGNLFY